MHIPVPNRLKGSPFPGRSRTSSPKVDMPALIPLAIRIEVIQARDLIGKDKHGTSSDPYITGTINDQKFQTHTIDKTLNPKWNATFDLQLTEQVDKPYVVEITCWDKDRFGKDYLGELKVSLHEALTALTGNHIRPDDPKNHAQWYALTSSRKKSRVSGEMQLRFSLFDPTGNATTNEQLLAVWQQYYWRSMGADLEDTLNKIRSNGSASSYLEEPEVYDADEGVASESAVEDMVSVSGDSAAEEDGKRKKKEKRKNKKKVFGFNAGTQDVLGLIFLEIKSITDLPPERNMTRTGFDMDPFVIISFGKKTFRTKIVNHSLNPYFNEKLVFQVMNHEKHFQINFKVADRDKFSNNDSVAFAILPADELISIGPQADPETGLYHLPEPLKEVDDDLKPPKPKRVGSRLGMLNPMSRGNSQVSMATSAATGDKNGGPDPPLPSQATVPPDSEKALAAAADPSDEGFVPFDLPLDLVRKEKWEDKHRPEIHIRAKFVPYPALRQQFWRCLLRQYDADDSGNIDRVELVTMLDSLGSTLKDKTINGFFRRFSDSGLYMKDGVTGKRIAHPAVEEQITFDQAIICLEDMLDPQRRGPNFAPPAWPNSGSNTPSSEQESPNMTPAATTESMLGYPLSTAVSSLDGPTPVVSAIDNSIADTDELADNDDRSEEHVIVIEECPLCHQPRMHKKADVDIVTHLATCASQDWKRVDRLVMGDFVTPSQAQRKWYVKVISKVTYGGYKLGANSANILVQDRLTGLVQEERMSVYVRLGIRLLYKGMKSSRMESSRIRKLLKSMSEKQGKKYDSPSSAKEIRPFINFHQLDMTEVLEPMENFKNFNQFFYRKLKPGARKCTAPDDPSIAVSPADCRSVVFDKIEKATEIWIKGTSFSIGRLFGDAYPEEAKNFEGGAIGIFRLAPQDYHRFHVPVDGVLGEPKSIKGNYYTVNPMAIRSALDVYGENVRVVVPIDSVAHGRVMVICVGAMMVGSTIITAKKGQHVRRVDELGYFKFGGSTLLVLFRPGRFAFDDDLVSNSKSSIETYLRAGMSIGHLPGQPSYAPTLEKENITQEDREDAARRIEGSLAPPRRSSSIKAGVDGITGGISAANI
ncbi:phosphatidylserine decarboxylase [Saitoella coloradoensis]